VIEVGVPDARSHSMSRRAMRFKWGYLWVTSALFLISLTGHWIFAWYDYVHEAKAHAEAIQVSDYLVETGKAMLENWQSEFLQLVWQVGGLMFLYAVGSPQSKEGEERGEAKLDWIMKRLDREQADRRIEELDERYPRS
jgi:hypothetical protein